jgi:hypothetical protein
MEYLKVFYQTLLRMTEESDTIVLRQSFSTPSLEVTTNLKEPLVKE